MKELLGDDENPNLDEHTPEVYVHTPVVYVPSGSGWLAFSAAACFGWLLVSAVACPRVCLQCRRWLQELQELDQLLQVTHAARACHMQHIQTTISSEFMHTFRCLCIQGPVVSCLSIQGRFCHV